MRGYLPAGVGDSRGGVVTLSTFVSTFVSTLTETGCQVSQSSGKKARVNLSGDVVPFFSCQQSRILPRCSTQGQFHVFESTVWIRLAFSRTALQFFSSSGAWPSATRGSDSAEGISGFSKTFLRAVFQYCSSSTSCCLSLRPKLRLIRRHSQFTRSGESAVHLGYV